MGIHVRTGLRRIIGESVEGVDPTVRIAAATTTTHAAEASSSASRELMAAAYRNKYPGLLNRMAGALAVARLLIGALIWGHGERPIRILVGAALLVLALTLLNFGRSFRGPAERPGPASRCFATASSRTETTGGVDGWRRSTPSTTSTAAGRSCRRCRASGASGGLGREIARRLRRRASPRCRWCGLEEREWIPTGPQTQD